MNTQFTFQQIKSRTVDFAFCVSRVAELNAEESLMTLERVGNERAAYFIDSLFSLELQLLTCIFGEMLMTHPQRERERERERESERERDA